MKTSKKLLHSSLILGLTFGNISGPVVEAVSMLSSIENKIETKEKTKEKTKKTKDTVKINSVANASDYKKIIEDGVTRRFSYILSDYMKKQTHKFDIGESFVSREEYTPFFDFTTGPIVLPIPPGTISTLVMFSEYKSTNSERIYTATTESGNWHIRLIVNAAAYLNPPVFTIFLTRMANNPVEGEEVFKNFPIPHYYVDVPAWKDIKNETFTSDVSFTSAAQVLGEIKVTIKSGSHSLWDNEPIPNPSNYIDKINQSNVIGDLKTEWETPPDMHKIGEQQTKIKISEERTGRKTIVTVPITIKSAAIRLTVKKPIDNIYQYEDLPDVTDYFNVTDPLNLPYSLHWDSSVSTNNLGERGWQAIVTSTDGTRRETASMKMTVIPIPEIELELEKTASYYLNETHSPLDTSFQKYIKKAKIEGVEVDPKNLTFVATESIEPNYSVAGNQRLKITVQTTHSPTGKIIKGSAETTVNILWGNTILMRSANGGSAGAFSLNLNKANTSSATIVMRRGLDSPWDEAVNPNGLQFSPYYKFEVLRNGNPVYAQEIINRSTLQEIMNAFGNNNNEITVQMNDIIKITHPEKSAKSSVIMIDEKEHDFTYGSDYAYYRVTQNGLVPAPVVEAESAGKVFVLGEDTRNIDSASLIENATINGEKLDKNQYTVEALDHFDTSTIGSRKMRVRINMKDGIASEEFEINYSVGWGSTFVLKGLDDTTVGAFSLLNQNGQWALQSSQGVNGTNLSGFVNNHFG